MPVSQSSELLIQLTDIQTRLAKKLEYQLSVHGISFTEFLVMFHLNNSQQSGLRRIDLAERTGLSASGITRLLLPMEKTGLIEKEANARDARVSLVKLSKAGKKIFSEAEQSFNYGTELITSGLTEKQKRELAKFLGALA